MMWLIGKIICGFIVAVGISCRGVRLSAAGIEIIGQIQRKIIETINALRRKLFETERKLIETGANYLRRAQIN